MINIKLLQNINLNDEWYTQKYAVKPILEFLKPNSKILCPFDTKDSEYVKVLTEAGHYILYTHIDQNKDFFTWTNEETKHFDYIISNPPFSKRKQVIEHLFTLGKPFVMLMPLVSITLKPIREKIAQCELLVFDKIIKFISNNGMICKNPPSETAYICHNVLPYQIMYRKLEE
ncbi:sugar-phosphate nucleotidyltransferase [Spiroplasma poulsonii]|uniref:Sugar-phosphate nucleotidyltransferase n=1 Tax=Spiroplasma poulsonii TaxID=2138 RepID=A0A3S0ZV28_9MOLU|nr:sugar-phosphate nucleotidyltransferase [Spiroplasma poulsonii]RUP75306.1 sugar-phosphate nucleotidyltransferase [Spiroplasma poulsonii]